MVDYLGVHLVPVLYTRLSVLLSLHPKVCWHFLGSVSSVERGLNACVVEELTCWLTEL